MDPLKTPEPIAKLEARTQSVVVIEPELDYVAPTTIGELLAYIARISNPGNQHNNETAPRLLNHCLENGHWSVFESASLTITVTTSRAIAHQVIRHRSFCFQEYSQRYAAAQSYEHYEARRQDKKNRQSSLDDMSPADLEFFREAQEKVWELSFGLYTEAIRRGVALECARFLLPLATTTTLSITGNIRSWLHYCCARCQPGVQKEHRDIAWACLWVLLLEVPELAHYLHGKLGCAKIYAMLDPLVKPHSWKWLLDELRSGKWQLHYSEDGGKIEPFHPVGWNLACPDDESQRYKQSIFIKQLNPINPLYDDADCIEPETIGLLRLEYVQTGYEGLRHG